MTLYKNVNGERVEMSAAEEQALRDEWEANEAKPTPVPSEVTMRQARLALSRAGKLADAETAIAGMTGTAGEEAQIEWEYATTLQRDHPLVQSLGPAIGLDADDLDDLFIAAGQIV
ncbi:hypothetical protein PVV74_17315 [Roseovarius sp. SK2]|uniref:hypothetical protein n=1 Tax=Roseovarius TaxID=74030 RepID=UPI00237B893F|nr:hypothetical protein [Roseovarius sp. SK2]MDD9727223.1 hypothetical protein [Roseovarius sp. SK2]